MAAVTKFHEDGSLTLTNPDDGTEVRARLVTATHVLPQTGGYHQLMVEVIPQDVPPAGPGMAPPGPATRPDHPNDNPVG